MKLRLSVLLGLLLVWGQGNAFVLLGSKWGDPTLGTPGGTITYSFLPESVSCGRTAQMVGVLAGGPSCRTANPDAVFGSDYESLFADAFASWSQWANIDFALVADDGTPSGLDFGPGHGGQIRIGAARMDTSRVFGFSIIGPGGTNDGFGAPADIFMSANFGRWDSDDLMFVALHEIGHSIGLDHSLDFSSVMSAGATFVRPIGVDDIAGIQALYGARTTVPEPGSWCLVLAGLGLLGVRSRRRQR